MGAFALFFTPTLDQESLIYLRTRCCKFSVSALEEREASRLAPFGRFGTGLPISLALREYWNLYWCSYVRGLMLTSLRRTWEVGSSLVALGITARVGIPLTFFVSDSTA